MARRLAVCLAISLVSATTAIAQVPAATPAPAPGSPVPSVTSAPQAPRTPPPPPYQSLRFDEDYSYLKDPARRTDFWDPVKYMPLGTGGNYLSLGGEVRERYEAFINSGFGAGPQNPDGYLLQRYQFHADAHVGSNLRFFGQVQSGLENGRIGGPRPTDEDDFEIHQAFADIKFGNDPKKTAYVRLGRQELEFWAGRLISASELLNVRRSFDGGRMTGQFGAYTVHAIGARPVETNPGAFDDKPDGTEAVWGVGIVHPNALVKGGTYSLYYIGFDRKTAVFTSGTGAETRHSIGARFFGASAVSDYNYEVIGQFGTFAGNSIRAWAISTDSGRSLPSAPLKPRLGLKVDIGSGDDDPKDGSLGTFNPLFPSTAYSGKIGLLGPQNIIDLEPSVRLKLSPRITATGEWGFFWRTSTRDGIYGISLSPFKSGALSTARYVANQPDLQVAFAVNRHLTLVGILTQFRTGTFIEDTPPSKNVGYWTTYVTYKF